ncbi:MAG: M24 family metallopeptidase [Gammaproteobacteria bacterium]
MSVLEEDRIAAAPPRGFSIGEFESRTNKAQAAMAAARLDALLLTTEPDVRYFSGFHTQFWASPTRPWFLLVPAQGKPVAVIPGIGATGMAQTWVEDIRTWSAPRPEDDGVSLLSETIASLARRHGRIGVPLSHESHLRMPAADFARLRDELPGSEFVDARPAVRTLQSIKSEAEIDKIRQICQLTSFAFQGLGSQLRAGQSERDACRALMLDLIARGADSTPYVMGASGAGSYDNIIMGPTDRLLGAGDVLIIDTGATYDGYFCDFDRNYAFGQPGDAARRAYEVVYAATEAGLEAARPGATTTQLWAAMWKVLEAGGALGNDVGRMGHGLGMQLTEWPSNMPGDDTVLQPGMVITLEPGMAFAAHQLMVHEEDIVIRDGAPELLTRRAWPEMPVIG